MSRKSSKILLVLVTILSLISTFSLATDGTPVTTSEDATVLSTENNQTTEGATENSTTATGTPSTESNAAEVNNDLYLAESDVKISDTVNGNAFIMTDTLTITGQIGGDLFVIANTINIDGGQIYGNVFAIADTITLNGLIYDLYATCGTLTVSYDGVAYRDLKVMCDNATINGVIGKDINITASSSLTLESDCLVYGNLNYTAPNETEVAEGLVTGTINFEKLGTSTFTSTNPMDYIIAALTGLVYTLVIWLLMSRFAPKFYGKVTELAPKKIAFALLIGLIALVVIPFVAILLMFTVVGVPVAIALLVIYGLLLATSSALTVIALAAKLANKVKALAKLNNLFAVIIVSLVLWALTLIPFVSLIVSFLTVLAGLGIFVMLLFKRKAKAVESKIEE